MTVRLAVAGTPVIPESVAGGVLAGDLEQVSERSRLAVAFANVLMTQPGQLGPDLIAALKGAFTAEELAELTVKVLKFNMQKVTVVCGHDMTVTPEVLAGLGWGADGTFVAQPSPA